MNTGALLVVLVGGVSGAAIARVVRLPMWALTGSIVGSAVAHALFGGPSSVPGWWSLLGQLLVGAVVGSTIVRGLFREFNRVLLPGTLAVVSIIGLGIALGVGIARVGGVDEVSAVFGMVPGGVGEMVAAATALRADSALVAGMHTARLIIVLSSVPLLLRLVERWGPDDEQRG